MRVSETLTFFENKSAEVDGSRIDRSEDGMQGIVTVFHFSFILIATFNVWDRSVR